MNVLDSLPILVVVSLLTSYLVSQIGSRSVAAAILSFVASIMLGVTSGVIAPYIYEWFYPLLSLSKEQVKHHYVNKGITSLFAELGAPWLVYFLYAVKNVIARKLGNGMK
jgi:hypothetical protein